MIYTEEQQEILEAGVGSDTPVWDLTKLYLLVDPDYPLECWSAYGALRFLHIDVNGWSTSTRPEVTVTSLGQRI